MYRGLLGEGADGVLVLKNAIAGRGGQDEL